MYGQTKGGSVVTRNGLVLFVAEFNVYSLVLGCFFVAAMAYDF